MLDLRKMVLICLFVILSLTTIVTAQEVKLIANSDVQIDSLSVSEVKDIFLGKKTLWDNGGRITFFISKETAVHKAFLESYIGKSVAHYNKIWRRCVFSGRGKAPKSSGSDQEMVNLVSETRGAIGYVSAGADTDGVKILSLK